MLEIPSDILHGSNHADLFDAVTQLEQTAAESTGRTNERLLKRCRVLVRPGDSTARDRPPIDAASLDVSPTGCRLVAPRPFRVGDIYWLEFARDAFDLRPAFARCLRCRFVREDAFEGGFAFFQPITLPGQDEEAELDSFL